MKLARALNLRATHGDTLVMRSSLDDDEDQGAEVPAVVRARARARSVPDRPVNGGNLRSFSDNTAGITTWLDAREPSRGGDLTRKRSLVQIQYGPRIVTWCFLFPALPGSALRPYNWP